MPGLVGIVKKVKRQENLLDKMIGSMCHEPWYKIDKFLIDDFAIARIHLGILNPEPQPIYNEDKTLCIFMDGEIFDYAGYKEELKQKGHNFCVDNDPEFCLHLYEEQGDKFVDRLNGSFVIVIVDVKSQRVVVVNDRYGLRPLYYAEKDERLLFGSEVKAILEDNTFKKEINDEAVAEFFTFGQLLGNKTFFKDIDILPPASILKWENGNISIEPYWEFKYDEKAPTYPEEYYVEELVRLFKQAVERRLKGDHRFAVFLSGGGDSRAVLAAIDEKHCPVTAITFSFPNIDSSPKIAKRIAQLKGASYREFKIIRDFFVDYARKFIYITDGMISPVHASHISLLDGYRAAVDIGISGWEPETTFKGEFSEKKMSNVETILELYDILYKRCNIISKEILLDLFSNSYYKKIEDFAFENIKKEINKLGNKYIANKNDCFLFLNREQRLFLLADSISIRSAVENRLPFRDYDLIDFALGIPPELRYDYHIYFKFLKRLSPELFNIPVSPAGTKISVPVLLYKLISLKGAILRKIIRIIREKSRGFIKIPLKTDYPDYGEWIRVNERLRQWVEDILLDERTLSREYFNRDFIVKMISDHMDYKRDYTQLIFLLLTFELWYKIFIEGEGIA